MTASESGERHASPERSPTEPEPELTPREARQRERESRRGERPQGMVPGRERRRTKLERGSMRLVATGGIIGIAVVLGAVLVGQDVAGWIVGLVVMYGSGREVLSGLLRALPEPDRAAPVRAFQVARGLPRMAREQRPHLTAMCEVAGMLAGGVGLPASVSWHRYLRPAAGRT